MPEDNKDQLKHLESEFLTNPENEHHLPSVEQNYPTEVENSTPQTEMNDAEAIHLVHSSEDEEIVDVPEYSDDTHQVEQKVKAPEALVLENLLDHELQLSEASDDQEEILNLSQQ